MADKRCFQETDSNLVISQFCLVLLVGQKLHNFTPLTLMWYYVIIDKCISANSSLTEDKGFLLTSDVKRNTLNHCTYHGFKVRHINVAIFIHFHHLNLHARHLCAGRVCSMSWFGNQTDLNKSITYLIC